MTDDPKLAGELIIAAKTAYDEGRLEPKKKCCGKCAFRPGSPERSDPWTWMKMVEGWKHYGLAFICHEGIPGHQDQVAGEQLRVCAGFHATRETPEHALLDLAHMENL